MRQILPLIIAATIFTGCAVKYAPRIPGVVPGYKDVRLGETTHRVTIGESWPKDWPDLEKFAMFRASEVTKQNGKRYFVIIDASSRVSSYAIQNPTTTTTAGNVNDYGGFNATSTTTGGGVTTIQGGWYTLDYKIISDDEVGGYKEVVDSDEIIKNLKYFIDSRR